MYFMESATYILPIRSHSTEGLDELTKYLHTLRYIAPELEVIIVDGSPAHIFTQHSRRWLSLAHHHLIPDPAPYLNGKVRGVLTGLRVASHDRIITADEDVRFDRASLTALIALLDTADVVRPQNYFVPNRWHTLLDSGRSLLNRISGGDWPGTMAFRRERLSRGYNGDVLFENLELVRTIRAAGGKELVAYNTFVARRPPHTARFLEQRVRQAYDEFARPERMMAALSVLPLMTMGLSLSSWKAVLIAYLLVVLAAECGRHKGGAVRVFPVAASFMAPLWVLERGVSAWLALGLRIFRGGIYYSGTRISIAATPLRALEKDYARG